LSCGLFGEFHAGQLIVADAEDDKIVFRAVDNPSNPPAVELASSGGEGS